MVTTQFPSALNSANTAITPGASGIRGREEGGSFADFSRKTLEKSVQSPAASPGFKPLTAEQAANNILGFIDRQLMRDKESGASSEELEARLQAGLRGFKQGFNEARERLEALSMLNPAVDKAIGKTHDLVLEGIDTLALSYLGRPLSNPSDDSVRLSDPETVSARARTSVKQESYTALRAESFAFELTTREGDRVTISAARQDMTQADISVGKGAAQMRYEQTRASEFSLSVSGDLNDEERAAIDQLLQQVDALAADFYRGDLDSAFESALSLGYDPEQIGAFSINLTRTEIQRASRAYGDTAAGDIQSRLQPLGHFAKDLGEALNTAAVFDRPQDLLTELADKMMSPDTDSERLSFAELVAAMLAEPAFVSNR